MGFGAGPRGLGGATLGRAGVLEEEGGGPLLRGWRLLGEGLTCEWDVWG